MRITKKSARRLALALCDRYDEIYCPECRMLLSLYEDADRASADVKAIALGHLAGIDRKIAELQSLRSALGDLIEACHGDHRPDCPILDDIAGNTEISSQQ
jgi:DNA-binding transcriptional MerR regulator